MLTYPTDIDAAWEYYGANCGPCTLAALLGRQVLEMEDLFEGFSQRTYVNPTHMKHALTRASVSYRSLGQVRPIRGLGFVQMGGYEHLPVKVQYRHTHWIAIDGETVFEVNADELTTWHIWQQVFPRVMQEEGIGNGTYWIRSWLDVPEVSHP